MAVLSLASVAQFVVLKDTNLILLLSALRVYLSWPGRWLSAAFTSLWSSSQHGAFLSLSGVKHECPAACLVCLGLGECTERWLTLMVTEMVDGDFVWQPRNCWSQDTQRTRWKGDSIAFSEVAWSTLIGSWRMFGKAFVLQRTDDNGWWCRWFPCMRLNGLSLITIYFSIR